MVDQAIIREQMNKAGVGRLILCNPEIKQLSNILVDGEVIEHMMGGRYTAGYAIIVATNLRLLVVDKMVGGIVIEDVPYDMIAEVQFIHMPLKSQLTVFARSKQIDFKAFMGTPVRQFAEYLQRRMLEVRQQINQAREQQNDKSTKVVQPAIPNIPGIFLP